MRTWTLSILLCLGRSGSPGPEPPRTRDPNGCRDWVDPAALAVPEVQRPLGAATEPPVASACLSGEAVLVGRRRIAFDAAHAGERLSAELEAAMPATRGAHVVDLWAPASRDAHDVLLVAQALGRVGARVRLIGRRGDVTCAMARIETPRSDAIPAGGEAELDVWLEIGPERLVLKTTDGTNVPIEDDPSGARSRWDELWEALRGQRQGMPDRHRLAFAPSEGVSYADWARALEIAARRAGSTRSPTRSSRGASRPITRSCTLRCHGPRVGLLVTWDRGVR